MGGSSGAGREMRGLMVDRNAGSRKGKSTPRNKAEAQSERRRRWRLDAWRRQAPLIGGFLLLLAVAAGSVLLMIANHRFNASVARTLQIRSETYRLLTLVQDAETGQRGYLLTGDKTYLRPYTDGIGQIAPAIVALKTLTERSTTQAANMAALDNAIRAKLRELADTVALVDAGDTAAALARVRENVGNKLMDTIRTGVDRLEAEEERLHGAENAAADFNNQLLAAASLVGIAVVIGLAAITLASTRRSTLALLRSQEKMRETNDNLEHLVAERVSELQLANEEIQRFAYIVSHDLRAPLVNVMGFTSELETARGDIAGLLRDVETRAPDLVTPDRRMAVETDLPEALSFIRTSTAKMDRLINAILKLSREGRRVLTPQHIDLRALVQAQGESLSQQLSAGEAALSVQEDLPGLVSDRLAIEQIFGNLIENAIKYLTPGRPGLIRVNGKTHGAYLRYDVTDNGRGIETKDFERVFELFRRSGEQDKPGEGIGLAYVRNLARRLGGNVTVQSVFGEGSTFTVTLPAVFSNKKAAR